MSTTALPLSRESDIYKSIALILIGAVTSLAGAYLMQAHNTVTRDELPGIIKQYNPYEGDEAEIKMKLDDLSKQMGEQKDAIVQLQVDTGRISERVGVAAHPAVERKR